jgi:hypothetical protein
VLSPILPPVSFSEISELELPSVGVVDEGLSVTVADASDGPLCLNSDPVGRGRDVARVVPKLDSRLVRLDSLMMLRSRLIL